MSPPLGARSGVTVAVAALACLGTVLVPLSPASAAGWFHDPVSASERRAEVPVPAHPARFSGGKVRHTVATYRARSGSLAVPIGWADGHRMKKGQAVVIQGRAFGYNSGTPSRAARRAVHNLRDSLTLAQSVRCEGYADFGGDPGYEGALSNERARKVCAIIRRSTVGVSTKAVGYGISRPVVLGGNHADRRTNRRVVIKVTGSDSGEVATAPSAPVLTDVLTDTNSLLAVFDKPVPNGGSPILRYQVQVNGGAWVTYPLYGGFDPSVNSIEILGLTPGTEYTVRVRAVNAVGPSKPSNAITVTTESGVVVDVPSAPTITADVSDFAGSFPNERIVTDLTFDAPADDGGGTITGYQLRADGGAWVDIVFTGSGPYTTRVEQDPSVFCLESVDYEIRAVNSAGFGLVSAVYAADSYCP